MKYLMLLVFLFAAIVPVSSQTEFSQENATNILKVLSVDIGPRPMGSPAERQAMEFAIGKFKEYGCDTAYIMEMDRTARANTRSGIAIGIKRGATKRIIVIGGHIDSAGPEIPGADDDGSGSATVIEAARVLCARETQSTILFGCWGGEEQGLEGSQYFVDHYENLDSIVLMLQVDMANGLGIIDMDPDMHGRSAPSWLVRAAVEEFTNLGYSNLRYPTHFFSMNYAAEQGSGSDHESFLLKGIPAIDFSTDVSKPIHTPRDIFENFDPRGLKRSGDLIIKLFERFDGGTPSRTIERYWLYLVGNTPIFIPYWGIGFFACISIVLSIVAFISVRRRREAPDSPDRVRWSGIKMFLYSFIIIACAWLSSDVVALMKGVRHPWFADFEPYYVLALLASIVGLCIVLMINKKLRLSRCPYVLYKRSIIILYLYLILLMFASMKLAMEPAMAIFLISLAMLIRQPYLRATLAILSPIWMLRFIASEWDGLMFRTLAEALPTSLFGNAIINLAMILVFSIYMLPFLFAFAAVQRDTPALEGLTRFLKSRIMFAGAVFCSVIFAVYLSLQPSYSALWYRQVHAEEIYDMNRHSTEISVSSPEYLNGVTIRHAGNDTLIDTKSTMVKIHPEAPFDTTWLAIERKEERHPSDTVTHYHVQITLKAQHRPYTVQLSYSKGEENNVEGFDTPLLYRTIGNAKRINWYSFPDTVITIPVKFTVADNDSVNEKIEVVFDTLAYPMDFSRDLTYWIQRTKYVANWVYKK